MGTVAILDTEYWILNTLQVLLVLRQPWKCYTPTMWPFSKKGGDGKLKGRRALRRVIVGFIIGGAISSIIGKSIMKERRKEHLGEDRAE